MKRKKELAQSEVNQLVISHIKRILEKKHDIKELAKNIKSSRATIYRILDGRTENVRLSTLQRIEAAYPWLLTPGQEEQNHKKLNEALKEIEKLKQEISELRAELLEMYRLKK